MPGVLERMPLRSEGTDLVLSLPADLGDLASERLMNRLKQLARLVGRQPRIHMTR
jgi:exopolyphosphatase/guanosine-5'-triphosphate,3'-diphosphate pyrophosphatase